MLKKYLEAYSNCCGAFMPCHPDSDICPDCKEHCGAILDEEIMRKINCHEALVEALQLHEELEQLREMRDFKYQRSIASPSNPLGYSEKRRAHQEYLDLCNQFDALIDKVDIKRKQALAAACPEAPENATKEGGNGAGL